MGMAAATGRLEGVRTGSAGACDVDAEGSVLASW